MKLRWLYICFNARDTKSIGQDIHETTHWVNDATVVLYCLWMIHAAAASNCPRAIWGGCSHASSTGNTRQLQPHITHGWYKATTALYCPQAIQGSCSHILSMGNTTQLQPHIVPGWYEAVAAVYCPQAIQGCSCLVSSMGNTWLQLPCITLARYAVVDHFQKLHSCVHIMVFIDKSYHFHVLFRCIYYSSKLAIYYTFLSLCSRLFPIILSASSCFCDLRSVDKVIITYMNDYMYSLTSS